MKKIAVGVTFLIAASAANAGALNDPIVETPPAVIVQETADSSAPSASLIMALSVLTVFGAALSH